MLVPLTMIGIGLALLVVGLPMGGRAILRFRTRQATAEELARPSRGVLTLGQAASGTARAR